MLLKIFVILTCFTFTSLHAQQNTSSKYGNNPQAGSFYNHDGVKVYYEIYGQLESKGRLLHKSFQEFTNTIPHFFQRVKARDFV